jgi:hypothetical protein
MTRGKTVGTTIEVNQRQRILQISTNLKTIRESNILENQLYAALTKTRITRNHHHKDDSAEIATTKHQENRNNRQPNSTGTTTNVPTLNHQTLTKQSPTSTLHPVQ